MLLNVSRKILKSSIKLKNILKVNSKRCSSLSGSTNNNSNSNNKFGRILTHPDTIQFPRISYPEYIFTNAEPYSDLTAYECSETKRRYTYREVEQKSRNLSKALRKKIGLKKNDTILLFLPNVPELPITIMGCLWAGIIVSPINPIYTSDEIEKQIKDASPKLIITSCELYDKAKKANEKLPKNLPIICLKTKNDQLLPQDTINWHELANSNIDIPDFEFPDPDDLALLPYSSGTTGNPKGILLSHFNLIANSKQSMYVWQPSIRFGTKQFQEVIPLVIPMFHLYGLTVSINSLITGSLVVSVPKFTPDSFVKVLDDYNVSIINAAPPLVIFMTNYDKIKAKHFKHMNYTVCGAAPLGLSDEERYLKKMENNSFIRQSYGLSEASPTLTTMPEKLKREHGKEIQASVGVVVPNTQLKLVKVDDQSGTPVGPHELGEVLAKGPQVMQGYLNKPEETANAFLDGWLKTGDLGYYDDKYGCLYITDRIKELIKVKGFQVPPAELEQLLRNYPNITEAAVIGIPDAESGEIPRAYIQTNGKINIDDIHKFVNEKVAKYKRIVGGIEIMKEIPKNTTGKILRKELKLHYEKNRS